MIGEQGTLSRRFEQARCSRDEVAGLRELFFPVAAAGYFYVDPRPLALCLTCPVAGECFVLGSSTGSSGIFGGMLLQDGQMVTFRELTYVKVRRRKRQADQDAVAEAC